jgi:hypothetical protein
MRTAPRRCRFDRGPMKASRPFRLDRFFRGPVPCGGTAFARAAECLALQREMRSRGTWLTLQRFQGRFRACRRCLVIPASSSIFQSPRCGLASLLASGSFRRRRQIHTRAASLRQPDGDGLLRRSRSMLPFANVIDLFANELARLRRRRFPFRFVFPCASQSLLLWHLRILR